MEGKDYTSFLGKVKNDLSDLAGDESRVHMRTRRNRASLQEQDIDYKNDDNTPSILEGTSTRQAHVTCDRCERAIPNDEIRMKCKDCPNFDYCPGCFGDAKRTHPTHGFKALRGYDPPPPGEYKFPKDLQVEAMNGVQLPLLSRATSGPPDFWCRTCQDVAIGLAKFHTIMRVVRQDVPYRAKMKALTTEWSVRVACLAQATALGCPFCAYILSELFRPKDSLAMRHVQYIAEKPWYLKADEEAEAKRSETVANALKASAQLSNDRVVLTVKPSSSYSTSGGPWLEKVSILWTKSHAQAKELSSIFDMTGTPKVDLYMFAMKDDPAAQDVIRSVPNASAASEAGFAQMRSWYHNCLENHGGTCFPLAGMQERTSLPTRVIDISNSPLLRIQETIGLDSDSAHQLSYCALSYQWGGPQDFNLSKASLSRLKEGFVIEEIPVAIADAVRVVQNLGIRYLWIDALCIVQDDEVDKAQEISRMDNIYRYAAATIIAANIKSVNESFLKSSADDETGMWRSLIPLRYPIDSTNRLDLSEVSEPSTVAEASKSPRSWATVWIMDGFEHMFCEVVKDSVTARGWCLQERLMSPRVINYGRWPTWRCGKTTATDGGFYISDSPRDGTSDEFATFLSRLLSRQQYQQQDALSAKPDQFTLNRLLNAWYGTVGNYTSRKLSDPADRLPAIGGIASLVSQVTGMEYHAGLWRDNLLHDLSWYADTREWLNRPPIWSAPTWSWASVDCAAVYGHIDNSATPVASVISCTTKEGATGRFGAVLSGEVSIKGPMRKVGQEEILSLFYSQDLTPATPKSNSVLDWYRQMLEGLEESSGRRISKEELEENLPDDMFAMVTFKHSRRIIDEEVEQGDFYSGLLLQPVNDHYERMGSFKQTSEAWLDTEGPLWEETVIVIH